jgi:hypothetical protein
MDILILIRLVPKKQEIYFKICFFSRKRDYRVLLQEAIDSRIIFY